MDDNVLPFRSKHDRIRLEQGEELLQQLRGLMEDGDTAVMVTAVNSGESFFFTNVNIDVHPEKAFMLAGIMESAKMFLVSDY